ncbi:MAG: hypothetical protein K2J81_08080 [Treponemataceae bacterium]|nr:hypothetical protein [Treponemataceae bacterium]
MKDIRKCLLVMAALAAVLGLAACGDVNEMYPTKTIDSLEVNAASYSGVNIITWKAVKDARAYSVYRKAAGENTERCIKNAVAETYYYDNNVEPKSSYVYRIVAHPVDATVHDAAQREVTLTTPSVATDANKKGTWAPADTPFLDMAQYERDYNPADEVLSASTIKAELVASTGSKIRVKFPVKPYAKYTVKIGQVNAAAMNSTSMLDNTATVNGFDYKGTATVDLAAVYSGEKEVTVIASPFGAQYRKSTVTATQKVTVASFDDITQAVVYPSVVANGGVSAMWTNYDKQSKKATARIRFVPASWQGKEFGTDEYTIYRAIIGTDGEYLIPSDPDSTKVFESITELGSPKKDMDTEYADTRVYYYDDTLDISPDVYGTRVRYYVILNHEGKIKSKSGQVTVPYSAEQSWNYEPDEKLENAAWVQDLTMDLQGHLTVTAHSGTENPQFTYEAFDTLNEALVAVEQELKKSISLAPRSSFIDYNDYNYSGASSESLTKGKYYAFRFVSVSKTPGEADAVRKIIAVPQKSGDAYWLDIRSGSDNLRGYRDPSSVSVFVQDKQANTENTKYASVTLEWYDYYGRDVQYYNIYRADTSYNPSYYGDYESLPYTFVSTKQSESSSGIITYKDDSAGLQNISLGRYVVYKLEAVGRYGVSFGYAYEILNN